MTTIIQSVRQNYLLSDWLLAQFGSWFSLPGSWHRQTKPPPAGGGCNFKFPKFKAGNYQQLWIFEHVFFFGLYSLYEPLMILCSIKWNAIVPAPAWAGTRPPPPHTTHLHLTERQSETVTQVGKIWTNKLKRERER